ncbi:hypothetical protein EVAR_19690_1 [Eumeta japonica]|uniref:Uncharacterized protein n=1 Tax=Eumeta variegata TaxID=151549 RepID=A0A4C1V1Z5_EUMVA|nr:hypothetical protein EVAR_19690_1 [Eumeta japonica]
MQAQKKRIEWRHDIKALTMYFDFHSWCTTNEALPLYGGAGGGRGRGAERACARPTFTQAHLRPFLRGLGSPDN